MGGLVPGSRLMMVELPVSQFTVWMGWVTYMDNQVRSSSFIIPWHPVFDEGIGWITALKTALTALVWHLSEWLYQLIIMSLGSFKAENGFDFKERDHAKEESCFRNWRADPGKLVWETPCFIYPTLVSTASFFSQCSYNFILQIEMKFLNLNPGRGGLL